MKQKKTLKKLQKNEWSIHICLLTLTLLGTK